MTHLLIRWNQEPKSLTVKVRQTHGTKTFLNSNPIPLTKSLVIGVHSVSLLAVLEKSFSLVSTDGEDGSSIIWTVKLVYVIHLLKEINVTPTTKNTRSTQLTMSSLKWLAKTLQMILANTCLMNHKSTLTTPMTSAFSSSMSESTGTAPLTLVSNQRTIFRGLVKTSYRRVY